MKGEDMIRFACAAALLLASLTAGQPARADAPPAASGQAGDVTVSDAYARPTMGAGNVSAAFMTIRIDGDRGDRLVAGSSPTVTAVELHDHIRDGDVMRMRPVEAIPVEAGEPVTLAPGGLHVMLIGSEPLAVGDTVHLVLEFERNGPLALDVPVRAMRDSQGHGGQGHGGQGHGGQGHRH